MEDKGSEMVTGISRSCFKNNCIDILCIFPFGVKLALNMSDWQRYLEPAKQQERRRLVP